MSANAASSLTDNETRYRRLVEHVQSRVSGFEVISKKESRIMKLLSVILFFNKRFMTGYITTLYPRVYVPELPVQCPLSVPADLCSTLGLRGLQSLVVVGAVISPSDSQPRSRVVRIQGVQNVNGCQLVAHPAGD